MAQIGVLLTILGLTVALPGIGASSLGPWFCYRLVPASITSAITPCMFPCLFISPNEHPHIVVHNEVDGTPCKVTSGLHHETKDGRCSSGVCTVNIGPPVLKRKKRFVCLYTLAKLIKARRERRLLRNELEALKRLALLNNHRGVSYASGGIASGRNFDRLRGQGSRGSRTGSADRNVVEIHLLLPGAGGTGGYNPGTGSSGTVSFGNSVRGRNLGDNVRSGVERHPDFGNLGGDRINHGRNDLATERIGGAGGADLIPGSTDISVSTGSGSAGIASGGPVAMRTRILTNVGMESNSAGGTPGGNSMATVVTTNAGNGGGVEGGIGGHSGTNLENRVGLVTTSSSGGRRNSAAAVVGVTGVGMSRSLSGRGRSSIVRHGTPETVSGNVVGIGGVVSAAVIGGRHDGGIGVGSAEASYRDRGPSSVPGIGAGGSLFPNSDGSVSGGIASSRNGVNFESGSSRRSGFFGPTRGTGDSVYSDRSRLGDDEFGGVNDFGDGDGF